MFLGGFLGGRIPARGAARVWGTTPACGGVRASPAAPVGVPLLRTAIAAMANAAMATRLTRNADTAFIARGYLAIARYDLSNLRNVLLWVHRHRQEAISEPIASRR